MNWIPSTKKWRMKRLVLLNTSTTTLTVPCIQFRHTVEGGIPGNVRIVLAKGSSQPGLYGGESSPALPSQPSIPPFSQMKRVVVMMKVLHVTL